MRHDTKVQAAALAVMAGCFAGAGVLALDLSAQQSRAKLVYTADAAEGQPPQVALGIAMGAFRGVFVNWLWMRANELKEDGRHYEAVELAKAITTLQPRFPRAWSFHAWNLAYNISVTTQTAPERWNWVRQGVELLRGPGLKYNPNDLHIHKELAWIFNHKIQGSTDDANVFYKKMHAKEWHVLLGEPPRFDPTVRSREDAIKRFADWLQPIADAPQTMEALFAGPQGDSIRALVAAIKDNGLRAELDYDTIAHYMVDRAVVNSGRQTAIESIDAPGPKSTRFRQLIEDPAFSEAWPRLLTFIRARLLREVYRMDPAVMIRYTEKYGPIDWRSPAAHALYWAALGVEAALPRFEKRLSADFDFVNTDRIVMHAVQELYRTGTIYTDYLALELDPGAAFYIAVVEPNFTDTYGNIIDELRARSKYDNLFERGYSYYTAGYENFLKDAIRYFFRRGDLANAEKYRQKILTYEGQNVNDPDRNRLLALPLEEFVREELWDRQTSPSVAISEVSGALFGAMISLMDQDEERYLTQMTYARQYLAYYKSKQERITAVTDDPRMGFLGRDFETLAGEMFTNMMLGVGLDRASIAYALASDELRQYAFDTLKQRFARAMDKEPDKSRHFAAVFPEPVGMDVFRARKAKERAELEAERIRVNSQLK
jgi:hypothetical protein